MRASCLHDRGSDDRSPHAELVSNRAAAVLRGELPDSDGNQLLAGDGGFHVGVPLHEGRSKPLTQLQEDVLARA